MPLPDPAVVWRESRAILFAHRWRLAAGLAILLVGRLAGLVLPAMSKVILDDVIGAGRADLLPVVGAAALVAVLVQAGSGFALAWVLELNAQHAIHRLRIDAHRHLLRLPVAFFDRRRTGHLASQVLHDAEGLRALAGSGAVQLVGSLLTGVVGLGVLLWLDLRLTVVTLLPCGLYLGVLVLGTRKLRGLFRERSEISAEVTARLVEGLGGIRTVKAFAAERVEERAFVRGGIRLFRNVRETTVAVAGVSGLATILFGLTGTLVGVFGARAVLAGRLTAGDLVMFVLFTGVTVSPLVRASGLVGQVAAAFAGLDRLRQVTGRPAEDGTPGGPFEARLEGRVVFDGVSFAYREGEAVVRDVSFEAAPGTTTALVGPSGAGKSTLVRLVLAFDRPDEGRVVVDGVDLASAPLRAYRRQLGAVLQEGFLFDGTIAENIAYGRPWAGREEIESAGRVAHCDELVAGFPEGYDTLIGERGVRLSGGQRQRVAIARALLADPRILVLDEATSSLDAESEARIRDGMRALLRGRTTFVIAHRLSTIREADQILVLEEGRIVERGRHAELLDREGLYAALYRRQVEVASDRFVNPGESVEASGAVEDRDPIPGDEDDGEAEAVPPALTLSSPDLG